MRIYKALGITLFALLMGLILTHSISRADELYGKIRGTVTDQSGAVIPGVKVTVTNEGTGISKIVTSQADGNFEVVNLLVPATYDVVAEQSGFKEFVSKGIRLNVNQTYVVKAVMQVGQVSQHVTVEANPVQVDTTSMQLGTTITGNTIVDLPLNGRNWVQLQQLEPGVVASSDRFGNNYSTNGAETQQNSYLINGADTNDAPLNSPGIIPSPDAIGEFRMITNTINPEYGRNSGAIINAVIKNGTNQFHGDAFEFYRDTTLDARSFFQSSVSPFHQNQFGGTIGGPIKKDKAFFFFSYQGLRAAVPQAFSVPTVFSPAERAGTWPGLTTSKGTSAFPLVGDSGTTYPAGTPYSTIFSNGTIPTGDLNPLAVKLMNQFVPLPNTAANGYTFNPTTTTTQDQYLYRVDENINAANSIWVYGLWQRAPDINTLPFTGATLPGFANTDQRHDQEYTAAWNHTFSPTTLNEARFSYYRFNFIANEPQSPINPTSYGFTGILPQNLAVASLPVMSLTGFFTLGFTANGPQPRIDQTYDAEDNFTRIMGRHTFKAGFTMERFEVYNPFYNNLGGNFSYTGSGTFSTGLPGADFLLGVPDSYSQGSGSIVNARGREYYPYVQDQWQVKRNLTLTYGLGWDFETPWVDNYNAGETMMAYRPGVQSTVFPTAPIGFVYPGDPGINEAGGPTTPYTDVAPRFGFAWTPGSSSNWSIRGGFGIYYNRTEEELALQGLTNPPFSTTFSSSYGSPSFATPFTGFCSVTSGAAPSPCSVPQVFPFSPPVKGAKVNFAPFAPIGFGANTLSPAFGVPMSENYNLTIERQLSPSTILSIGYVGNVGRHLEGAYNLSYAGAGQGVNPGAAALGCNAFNLATCDPGSFSNNPNPALYGETGQQVTSFNSNYNSLQVELNRHFAHGLQFLASYTWSRYFDYTSNLENNAFNGPGIDPFNFNSMYAPSADDAPQRLVLSYDYTLPFYHFVHKWQRLTDGWDLVGISTFQSGFPVAVFDSAFSSLTCDPAIAFYACPDRANVVPGKQIDIGNPRNYSLNGQPNYWFNPAAFSIPAAGTGIGNASRNPIYGPGIDNWDLSLLKDIHITESKYFEIRIEAYNVFNQTQFAGGAFNQGSGGIVSDVNDPRFGRVISVLPGSTNGDGRVLQLGGKFYF